MGDATLYDLIMGGAGDSLSFSQEDWRALGRGEITDEETISKMMEEGYEGLVDED